MSKAESLYRLQLLDTQIDGSLRRLKEIEAALANNAAVAHAQHELTQAEKVSRVALSDFKSAELDAQGLDAKIQEEEKRLYGGSIKAAKEMLDTQKEVESLKKRRASLDDVLLAVMEKLEDAQNSAAHCKRALEHATQSWQTDSAHMRQERDELNAKLNALREQRQAAVVAIARADLDLYASLRTKKPNGVAVTLIKNGACGQCGETPSSTQLQQARVGSNLTQCTNCSRILYGM
jgi:hypothetical protein